MPRHRARAGEAMTKLPNNFRDAIDVKLGEMLACPTGGHERTRVNNVAILDDELISAAMIASIETGLSWVIVHIPVEWDVGKPVKVDAVTANDIGIRVQRDLAMWRPLGTGATLMIDGDGQAYRVTENGLVETPLTFSPEIRPGFGVARAVRALMAAALESAPETALAA